MCFLSTIIYQNQMGQWYWLYRETSEEPRRSWMHHGVVSMYILGATRFPPLSRSLAAYLFEYECCLEKMRGLPWKMTYEQWLLGRRRAGAFPDSVRILCSLLLWLLLKHLSWKKHMNMNNIFWPLKCSRLHQRADIIKIYPWPKGLYFLLCKLRSAMRDCSLL